MRRFLLHRRVDISGVSGTGFVAEGIEFSDGRVVLHWLTGGDGLAIYPSLAEAQRIHGHNGATAFEWIDTETSGRAVAAVISASRKRKGSTHGQRTD